jgi:type IV fimbrial biogenesis protein FimT
MQWGEVFRKSCQARGFTAMELIVTLTIMGILAVLAMPAFHSLAQGPQVCSAVNDLVSSFNYARSEAITRATMVTVCKSGDLQTCDTSDVGWEQGWIVYCEDDSGAMQILRANDECNGSVVMEGNYHVKDRIRYEPSGFMPGVSNGTISATLGDKQVDIIISTTGRVRTEKI